MVPASGSELSITVSKEAGRTTLALVGDLDLYTAARLREQLVDLIHGARPDLVVDLAGVDFADSTGLGTLVSGVQRARRVGGDLVLRSVTPGVRRSIEIMGLDRVLRLED